MPSVFEDAAALWVVHHDYSGLGRVRVIPPSRIDEVLDEGVTFGYVAWDYTVTGSLVPDAEYSLASGDYRVIPDRSTATRLPHVSGVVQTFSDLCDADGNPWDGDPRDRLRRVWNDLRSMGYAVRVGIESEFQVVAENGAGEWVPVEQFPMYSVGAVESQWEVWMARTLESLLAAQVPVHQLAREGAASQYECSLLPCDPIAACDNYLLARQIIKGSMRPGITATFMPKAYTDWAGNGLHVHISIVGPDGSDLLTDRVADDALSPVGLSVVSALVRHAPAQLALGAPTPNSFRRLVPGWGAPTRAAWSFGNRSALVRIPGPGSGRRLEYRSGDQSCNPYLHLLGILAVIADAIRSGAEAVAPIDEDLSLLTDHELDLVGAHPLPGSVPEALDRLAQDQVLCEALGPSLLRHYSGSKREEHETLMRTSGVVSSSVTAWERSTYLRAL
jgi:glutamine synthetase